MRTPRAAISIGVPVLLALLLATTAPAQEEGEWVRPYPPFLPGLEPVDGAGLKTLVSVRLLRETGTGRVFARGGRVGFYSEESRVVSPEARLLASGRVDEFGFANVSKPAEDGRHWHFSAPRHGAVHDFKAWDRFEGGEILLPGGVDHTICVLDPLGGPLAGARVETYLGCPHSPALRRGITDSGGVVCLSNRPTHAYGEIWIEAPGIWHGPYDLPELRVGERYRTILTDPARTARGIVQDPEGRPLAGIVVWRSSWKRGPVTTTDAEGRFTLHGLISGDEIAIVDPARPFDEESGAVVTEFTGDVPLRITLNEGRRTRLGDGEVHHVVAIDTTVRWRSGENAPLEVRSGTPVRMVRLSDGLTVSGETGPRDREGQVEDRPGRPIPDVPAGTYRITAGGPFAEFAPATVTVAFPPPDGAPIRILLESRQPRLSLHLPPGEFWGAELRVPGAMRRISLGTITEYGHLPRDGPAVLYFGDLQPIGPAVEGFRHLTWTPSTPHRIRFLLQDAEGRAIAPDGVYLGCSVDVGRLEDGSCLIRTDLAGRVKLRIEVPDFMDHRMWLDLPVAGPAVIDLGVLTVDEPRERSVRILDAEGRPVSAVAVHVSDEWGEGWKWAYQDEDGTVTLEGWYDPVGLRIEGGDLYSLYLDVSGEWPTEICLPGGRIRGEVRGLDGKLLPGVVYVDAHRFACDDGRFDIRGVPAGPHIVIVGAKDHVGEVRRVILGDGEARELAISLPPR